jgi:DNA mismatch endonuclease (patch repair protein)
MIDIVEKRIRSRMMAGIKAKHTRPELAVRQYLHAEGFRFRIHVKELAGTPDIVLPKYKLAILVHGCFWHRHFGCRLTSLPDDSTGKWAKKFSDTIVRDSKNSATLLQAGWRVFVLWECGLRKRETAENLRWLPAAIRDTSIQSLEWPNVESNELLSHQAGESFKSRG